MLIIPALQMVLVRHITMAENEPAALLFQRAVITPIVNMTRAMPSFEEGCFFSMSIENAHVKTGVAALHDSVERSSKLQVADAIIYRCCCMDVRKEMLRNDI